MGTQDVQAELTPAQRSLFMRALLRDVQALEHMLAGDCFDRGIDRIGAEQELVLVDADWQPAPVAMEVLADLVDERITTEIARFNLEGNCTPQRFTGDCLSRLETELHEVIAVVREACRRHGADVVLTGILPTLAKSHLGKENISDRARYFEIDKALLALRGGAYELQIEGLDEVSIEHDSVMLEALNTSFQIHWQVAPADFARSYNLAQALAGPLLAGAANSPVLFGKRLWRETRIAIFQQAVDTRHETPYERDLTPRVRFGERWLRHSVMEIFKDDIARFRVILGREENEDPFEALAAGRAPRLQALQLHNSTVYRWNRACYGQTNGKPHLRIENRVLPAGPTVADEVANAAFWFGLMKGGPEAYGDVSQRLDFDDARSNFGMCARQGMHAEVTWLDGSYVPVTRLILDELLPIAREGLHAAQVDASDVDRFLGVIEERARTRRSGAQWLLKSAAEMQGRGTRAERAAALTAGMHLRQHPHQRADGTVVMPRPVHEWASAQLTEAGAWTRSYQRVEQYMTRDLRTVHEEDTIDLVVTLMDWEHIRHLPVEDAKHRLVGVISYRMLLRHLAQHLPGARRAEAGAPEAEDPYSIPVRMIMKRDPVAVTPRTTTLDAIALMREKRVSCLPVVSEEGRLVGLVTEHDFLGIASTLFEEHLRAGLASVAPPPPTGADGTPEPPAAPPVPRIDVEAGATASDRAPAPRPES